MKTQSKYPPYPGSNWDYSVKESARQDLRPPNKHICLYCRRQSQTEEGLDHAADCPAKPKLQTTSAAERRNFVDEGLATSRESRISNEAEWLAAFRTSAGHRKSVRDLEEIASSESPEMLRQALAVMALEYFFLGKKAGEWERGREEGRT